jgi:ADP-ribose pyrophosphatase
VTFRHLRTSTLGRGVLLTLESLELIDPDGHHVVRDVVRHPGGVAVLPVAGERIWLVDQYRPAIGRRILEAPAGKLDRPGEPPMKAAERELEEELGMRPARLVEMGRMLPSPGYTDEVIHLYVADGIVAGKRQPQGAEEHDAVVVEMTLDDAMDRLGRGEIDDAKTQILLLAWMRRQT